MKVTNEDEALGEMCLLKRKIEGASYILFFFKLIGLHVNWCTISILRRRIVNYFSKLGCIISRSLVLCYLS